MALKSRRRRAVPAVGCDTDAIGRESVDDSNRMKLVLENAFAGG